MNLEWRLEGRTENIEIRIPQHLDVRTRRQDVWTSGRQDTTSERQDVRASGQAEHSLGVEVAVEGEEGGGVGGGVLAELQGVPLPGLLVDGVGGGEELRQGLALQPGEGLQVAVEPGEGGQGHRGHRLHQVAQRHVVRQPDGVAHLLEPGHKLLLGFKALESSS